MMKDNDKNWLLFPLPLDASRSHFYRMFMDHGKKPEYIAVDWAADNGMIRGEVIERNGNVVSVRFKTIGT